MLTSNCKGCATFNCELRFLGRYQFRNLFRLREYLRVPVNTRAPWHKVLLIQFLLSHGSGSHRSFAPLMAHISGDIHLPFDVITLIITELGSDEDISSLRACSLTCKAILPLARQHIFAKVEIDNTKEPEDCEKPLANRFTWLLESDPSIAD